MTPKNHSRAFTLVEILVVIGVIALLAAIVFPVFSRVREGARKSTCASNLRQIGVALMQYKNDNGNSGPFYLFTDTGYDHSDSSARIFSVNNHTWMDAVWPYVKNEALFTCPSYPAVGKKFLGGDPNWTSATATGSQYLFDRIGFNRWNRVFDGVPFVIVARPAETIYLCGDSSSSDCAGFTWGMGSRFHPRHNGVGNLLFFDGHVKAMRLQDTSDGPYDQTGFVCFDGSNRAASTNGGYRFSYWDNNTAK